MNSKKWIGGWAAIVVALLTAVSVWVYNADPYMHYHKPKMSKYYYLLDNQRSQNNGIIRFFDYDAIITGSSMTENFKTSELDELFGCNSVKVSFSGGSYKEINDALELAMKSNPNIKMVVRGLDMVRFFDKKDDMAYELSKYPTYLYDDNLLNDVRYIWNRDVIWNRVYVMGKDAKQADFEPGFTPFDEYSRWNDEATFGIKAVCPDGVPAIEKGEPKHLSDKEKERIKENIEQNVISLANENSQITFYYFMTPYSAAWWKDLVADGSIYKQIEAEQFIIEMLLNCQNIRLFSINNRTDITCDINNYMDTVHYGDWINSLILEYMRDGKYELNKDNYKKYLDEELSNYLNFDYYSLNEQEDYEDDYAVVSRIKD